ncbi:hypothetical protein GSU3555 [Geobacter sulfurreducens PCA]|uniref:Uncharacterized protein n=1 Tax=Geobacter sulfurreducens (strain ATCC 51573 / DSM 12127 / PCA) TaxID=243231 RepID=I7EP82_GEOSL|nr:hypothetical protein GSU3555 [Geobacter sulfurreducens PCA]HCD97603.1 hypothetical protein [Geobacter sulfurreducens]
MGHFLRFSWRKTATALSACRFSVAEIAPLNRQAKGNKPRKILGLGGLRPPEAVN